MSTKEKSFTSNETIPRRHLTFAVNRIVSEITGLNQAMFHRANSISRATSQVVTISTFHFGPQHYDTLQKDLQEQNRISSGVALENMYEYFRGHGPEVAVEEDAQPVPGLYIERKKRANRYFLNGRYIKYEKLNAAGYRERIDYYDDNRYNHKTEIFDSKGRVARTDHKDLIHGTPRNQTFHRPDGSIYLSKWLKREDSSGKNLLLRINLFDLSGRITNVFYSEDELKLHFLDRLVGSQPTSILAEARSVDRIVSKIENPLVKKMAIVHNMHLEPPHRIDDPVDNAHSFLLANVERFDALVLLTEDQRLDVQRKVGLDPVLHVIPHSIGPTPRRAALPWREPYRITMVARLAPQKRVEDAIRAMSDVVEQVPAAQLNIWGEGGERMQLEELIVHLGLENTVFLRGYTHSPLEQYASSDLSILTSRYEGFGLVILESLSQGCPVISYDLKYGPKDIIESGVNGFLVEDGNVEYLAREITALLVDRGRLAAMRSRAIGSMSDFDEKSYLKRWLRALS